MRRVPHVNIPFEGKLYPLQCKDFQFSLSSMPLDSTDSSGGTGELSLSFIAPQDLYHPVNVHGYEWAYQKPFEATFGEGYLTGVFVNGGRSENGNIINYTGTTAAHKLNVYNVVMPPYSGTLGAGIDEYISRLNIAYPDTWYHPDIVNRPVNFPGWVGEFWHHLKLLCAAEDIDILFTNEVVEFHPSRGEIGTPWGDTERNPSSQGANLAQYVEVYDYQNTWVEGDLIYPPGGWDEDVEILSVGANEYVEYELDLSTSLVSFQEPTMVEFVSRLHSSSSVYTVSGDDGFPIKPQQWRNFGGDVSFEVGEEFNTLIVKMRGPVGILNDQGEEMQNFSLALSADTGGGSQYSTLRILGTGVQYKREKIKVGTGVSEQDAGTEVGATIDNPFLSTPSQAYNAAIRAASKFQGYTPTLNLSTQGMTKGTQVMVGETLKTLHDGGQVYRVRDVTYSPEGLSVSAEGDLRLSDLEDWEDLSVSLWNMRASGLNCMDVTIKGTNLV